MFIYDLSDCCLRYCKSTIFQANHNRKSDQLIQFYVVCDTAKVRFFKQITTLPSPSYTMPCCLRYCKSTIFQANHNENIRHPLTLRLFAILQKYDFSSKSQRFVRNPPNKLRCLRYCKSTIFQANHNHQVTLILFPLVVCDTAKVRFFKQITTGGLCIQYPHLLFAILQKYDFSSKSQLAALLSALRWVVCDTAKVRFFKQITTRIVR